MKRSLPDERVSREHCLVSRFAVPAIALGWSTIPVVLLLIPALMGIGGCGRPGHPDHVKVHGTVSIDGQPLEKGQIRFLPIEGTKGPTSGAEIVDGKYSVVNRGGVPFGTHRVEIVAFRVDEDAPPVGELNPGYKPGEKPLEQYLPDQYNDRSQLRNVVPEGVKEHEANFDL